MLMLWCLIGSNPFMKKPSLPAIDPLLAFKSGALIFSPPTSSRFPRWSASLKRPSRMVSTFPCTPLSRTSYNTSTLARPTFLPIYGVFWSAFWSFLGTRARGSQHSFVVGLLYCERGHRGLSVYFQTIQCQYDHLWSSILP